MKNKNEVTGNLLLGCTVLRITREVPGAVTISCWNMQSACPATDSSHNIGTALEFKNPEDVCYSLMESLYRPDSSNNLDTQSTIRRYLHSSFPQERIILIITVDSFMMLVMVIIGSQWHIPEEIRF